VSEEWPRSWIAPGGDELPDFDISVANPARIWNYWLGGKDNFDADRKAAEELLEIMPAMPPIARITRRFLIDAVQRLIAERGIRQFLDIGTGLPVADSTHEVAQRLAPESRIVYVDNDPIVVSHARALLTSSPEGATACIHTDLRDPGKIVAEAAETLDFGQPVAVVLTAVLHFIPDAEDPYTLVADLMDAVPSGSYLVLSHGASDIQAEAVAEMNQRYNRLSAVPLTLRTGEQVTRFFDGLELLAPGVVPIQQWWDSGQVDARTDVDLAGHCGIGRKS
jgi:hypothetical protein